MRIFFNKGAFFWSLQASKMTNASIFSPIGSLISVQPENFWAKCTKRVNLMIRHVRMLFFFKKGAFGGSFYQKCVVSALERVESVTLKSGGLKLCPIRSISPLK